MWTDEDRSKKRAYLIYFGKKLKEKFNNNLEGATDRWNDMCSEFEDESSITLYHDKRIIDNQCCKYTST